MIYTIEELRERVRPVAEKYGLPAVYLFGSYARGEATEESDVDLLVGMDGSIIKDRTTRYEMYCDFDDAIGKRTDVVSTNTIFNKNFIHENPFFVESILQDVRKLR
ncbi:MAG: nucleotidyltransferase domain-containing protein [Ruminococcus sp.]|jgi:predicted nucleotidyltransferase|nr:nucleotidyltransferase domain-containing protein [Ruminococcus sp.]